jgi:hypothetical protein
MMKICEKVNYKINNRLETNRQISKMLDKQTQILFPYRKSNENTQAFHYYNRTKWCYVICCHQIHPTAISYPFRLCRNYKDDHSNICYFRTRILDYQFPPQKHTQTTHFTDQISNTVNIMTRYQYRTSVLLRTSSKLSRRRNYSITRDIYTNMSSLCMYNVHALHHQKDIT